jgi:hypothetical protein
MHKRICLSYWRRSAGRDTMRSAQSLIFAVVQSASVLLWLWPFVCPTAPSLCRYMCAVESLCIRSIASQERRSPGPCCSTSQQVG